MLKNHLIQMLKLIVEGPEIGLYSLTDRSSIQDKVNFWISRGVQELKDLNMK